MIDLLPLSTPREECLVLHTGEINAKILEDAKESRYDQLPVMDNENRICGVIETERAGILAKRGEALEPNSRYLILVETEATVELFTLLGLLGDHRAVVYRDPTDPDWFALVTISDLNRHPFRGHLYPLFARLESSIAELIDRTYDDPWTWIPWTPSHTRPIIVGRWELAQRDSVDTGPIAGCEIRDLFAVVTNSDTLRTTLEIGDLDAWKKVAQSLPDLRNDVMHPVRSLVTSTKRVRSLRKQLEQLEQLAKSAEDAVEELRMNGHGTLRFRP